MAKRASLVSLPDGTSVTVHAPGLKQVRRRDGAVEPYWVAAPDAAVRGYSPKTVRLVPPDDAVAAEALARRCRDLTLERRAWLDQPDRPRDHAYDGTIGSLVQLYLSHPDSPYHELVPTSRATYRDQLSVVEQSVGARRLDAVVPIEAKRWYKGWARPTQPGGPERIRRAYGGIQMLRVILNFGTSLGIPACEWLANGLGALRFKAPRPRTQTMDALAAERLIDVALAAGEPRMALGIACQFELTLRQSDVIGQRVEAETGRELASTRRGEEVWRGLTFEQIDARGVLRVVSGKTGRATSYDLSAYPLVQKALAAIPAGDRRGPVVARAGMRPMDRWEYAERWRELAREAGIPDDVWNRDLRASGVTEAREAGATLDDVAKVAGHAGSATTARIYDRSSAEASKRVQRKRLAHRKKRG